MTDARERLTHLVELAAQNEPEQRRALAFELCDLLLNWPERYVRSMRGPFEALLENVLRRLDATTRRMIAARLAPRYDTGVTLLNEIYFDTPEELRASILERNAARGDAPAIVAGNEGPLIEAARRVRGADFASAFAGFLGVPAATAQRILDDGTGQALAVACKGAHMRRATHSALALLTLPELRTLPAARLAQLASFEDIPQRGAEHLLTYWRLGERPVLMGARAA